MVEGYIINYAHANALVSRWVQGAPQPGFFWEVDPTNSQQFKIITYCCRQCGYLESYRGARDGA
jgi:hypothetical protein